MSDRVCARLKVIGDPVREGELARQIIYVRREQGSWDAKNGVN
jgi:hypothetical protein